MRYCLALDLKDDPALIAEYEHYHEQIWPEIEQSIYQSGITDMEIYRIGNRLFMIMETTDTFSFDHKNEMDADNPRVQAWENLMWRYQQALPMAKPGKMATDGPDFQTVRRCIGTQSFRPVQR